MQLQCSRFRANRPTRRTNGINGAGSFLGYFHSALPAKKIELTPFFPSISASILILDPQAAGFSRTNDQHARIKGSGSNRIPTDSGPR